MNAKAAYRLACYYEVPNPIFKRNEEKTRKFLELSKQWSIISGDSTLLKTINKGLNNLEQRNNNYE